LPRRRRCHSPATLASGGRCLLHGPGADVSDSPTSPDQELKGEAEALTQQLETGGEARLAAMGELKGSAWRMSLEPLGCRVVQLALKVADQTNRASLVSELHGHVMEAMESPHANYVVQQVVELMPTPMISFVAEEMAGAGCRAARHRYGCRIVCRLLEHSATKDSTAAFIDEVLTEASELSRHVFGHHVVQAALEHGLPRQRRRIAAALLGELARNARNRNASYVIETALVHCCPEDRNALATEIRSGYGGIVQLAQSQFGRHVVKALLRLPGEDSRAALRDILAASAELSESKHGRRLLEELPRLSGCAAALAMQAMAADHGRPRDLAEGG